MLADPVGQEFGRAQCGWLRAMIFGASAAKTRRLGVMRQLDAGIIWKLLRPVLDDWAVVTPRLSSVRTVDWIPISGLSVWPGLSPSMTAAG